MPQHHDELERIVDRWEQRHEWRLLSRTVPRSLIFALILSLLLGAVGYFRFRLDAGQLALLAAALCAAGVVGNLLRTLLFPRDLPSRARYFDLEFGLQERVSTAFELLSGRIRTHPEIMARQLGEALAVAKTVDPRERIALDFRRGELLMLAALCIALLGMIALPSIVGAELLGEPPDPAIEQARDEVREMIEETAKTPELDEPMREEALDALEIALERLEETDISQEEAFAALAQLEERLDELGAELGESIELDQSALAEGLDALDDYAPPMDAESEDAADNFDAFSEALEQLAQDARNMSEENMQLAGIALEEAAGELAEMDSELSERLDDMAQALQEGRKDLDSERDAAQERLSQRQNEAQRAQRAQMSLEEQSEQAQEAARAIARQQAQQGEQRTDNADAEEGGDPSEQGQPRSGQQSDQQSDSARPGSNEGSQASQRNVSSGAESQRAQNSRASGGGAGEGDPSNRSLAGGGGEDQGAESNNRQTGNREIDYEALYSPSGIGGGGQNEIRLETDPGDATMIEGEFDDNPLGESRVSYDTVFSDYRQAANRALESDYVPLGMRDVVRDYFTSLEPGG